VNRLSFYIRIREHALTRQPILVKAHRVQAFAYNVGLLTAPHYVMICPVSSCIPYFLPSYLTSFHHTAMVVSSTPINRSIQPTSKKPFPLFLPNLPSLTIFSSIGIGFTKSSDIIPGFAAAFSLQPSAI